MIFEIDKTGGKATRIRRERFLAYVADPEALNNICDMVSDGHTLTELSRKLEANYRWLFNWLMDEDHPERLKEFTKAEAARDSLMREDIIGQVHRIANLDMRDAYDDLGELLPIHLMPEHIAKALSNVETVVNEKGDVTKKVKFENRAAMLNLGGRRQGMFSDKVEVTGKDGEALKVQLIAGAETLLAKIRKSGASNDKGGGK